MSRQLISRSPDLKRLQDEGYDLEIRHGHLLVKHVPYVTPDGEVDYGVLVSRLDLAGDATETPRDHVALFSGKKPCDRSGQPLDQIINAEQHQDLGAGLTVDFTFSSKPPGGYRDYHEKMTTYVRILASPAEAMDPKATATTFPVIEPDDAEESVFRYLDTASSRAGITAVSEKLGVAAVAIIGLGGTGTYILDLVAKTPVREIHIFDGDDFLQHNAFRSPGAPSAEDLQARRRKTDYWASVYAPMRQGIIPHSERLDESNINELDGFDFVFLALDETADKRALLERLESMGLSFIDTGIGVDERDGALGGIVRITTSTPAARDHVWDQHRIPLLHAVGDDAYDTNIQVAELNALAATFAVIKWKKLLGFYDDLEHEHHSLFTIDGNQLTNDDKPPTARSV